MGAPSGERFSIQQSSMLTYLYPASRRPLETIASAISRTRVSLMSHLNVFQEDQPWRRFEGERVRIC